MRRQRTAKNNRIDEIRSRFGEVQREPVRVQMVSEESENRRMQWARNWMQRAVDAIESAATSNRERFC